MKEVFLEYELSLLAKQKGFDKPCLAHYSDNGNNFVYNNPPMNYELNSTYKVSAPTYDQLKDWFLQKHNILFIPKYDLKIQDDDIEYRFYYHLRKACGTEEIKTESLVIEGRVAQKFDLVGLSKQTLQLAFIKAFTLI